MAYLFGAIALILVALTVRTEVLEYRRRKQDERDRERFRRLSVAPTVRGWYKDHAGVWRFMPPKSVTDRQPRNLPSFLYQPRYRSRTKEALLRAGVLRSLDEILAAEEARAGKPL